MDHVAHPSELPPETVALLQRRIPELDARLADELAAELGDLPLAAAQAAAYLEQTGLPPAAYLGRFRTRRASLLAKGQDAIFQNKVHLGMQAKGFDDSKGRDPPDRPED